MTYCLLYRAITVILLSLQHGGTYFLSLNEFDLDEASAFCNSICSSKLASIHSESDNRRAVATIQHNTYSTGDTWIGLSDAVQSDHWEWDDGTTFDYGNIYDSNGRLQSGVYPWAPNEPTFNTSNDYVLISEQDSYQWIARYFTACSASYPLFSPLSLSRISHSSLFLEVHLGITCIH